MRRTTKNRLSGAVSVVFIGLLSRLYFLGRSVIFRAMQNLVRGWFCSVICLLALTFSCGRVSAADTLNWNTNKDSVSANIESLPVLQVLKAVAQYTGWKVYLEPNLSRTVSTKFKDLSTGEALRMLLGDLNFAIVPETNGPNHLYVFRTSMGSAIQLISPSALVSTKKRSGVIPNELIVTMKPGAKIDGLDCLADAHVTGRLNGLNVYRVQFDNADDANIARDCLSKNPSVASVDSNYSMEPPNTPVGVGNASPQFNLNPKANNGNCQIVVGLIDTHVQALGQGLDQFVLPAISVAGSATPSAQPTHGTIMGWTIMRALSGKTGGTTSVKILPVDVYGPNETTSTFDVANGIYQAVNGGANVINLSLGGGGDAPFLETLIQNAESQGVVFFAAAGNQPVTTPFYPAAYPGVEAVTASSAPGQVADYANHGSFVSLMLPGTSIMPYGGESWVSEGTSDATAYATGIAAGMADSHHDCPQTVIPTMQSNFGVNFGSGGSGN